MKQEYFFVPIGTNGAAIKVGRGEALRTLIAAIHDVAKVQSTFTTDDVFKAVRSSDWTVEALRKATANSKLIAVALHKVAKQGAIDKSSCTTRGGEGCHRRRKMIWTSNVVQ